MFFFINSMHFNTNFSIYYLCILKRETFKTKFKVNDGTKAIYLEEKEIYSRNY
jgi:hypothetical protein